MSLAATTLDMNRIQLTWNVDISSKQDKFSVCILKFLTFLHRAKTDCNVTSV